MTNSNFYTPKRLAEFIAKTKSTIALSASLILMHLIHLETKPIRSC